MVPCKKISLRRIKPEDLAPAFEARNDPSVYTWCRQNAPLHWANHLDWYNWQAKEPSVSMFTIELGSSFAGVCGLTDIDLVNSRAEFSLYISPKRQRAGLGENALILLLDYGFDVLGLNRIWGEVFDGNDKALHIFKKLGFLKEGIRREFYYRGGRHIDAHLVSINRAGFDMSKNLKCGAGVAGRIGTKPKSRAKLVNLTEVKP